MQILNVNYSTNVQNRQSFGMALYMSEEQLASKIGRFAAKEVEKARPQLEKLADDVNIGVFAHGDGDVARRELCVRVEDISPVIKFTRNPLGWLIQKIGFDTGEPFAAESFHLGEVRGGSVVDRLVEEADALKKEFTQSK